MKTKEVKRNIFQYWCDWNSGKITGDNFAYKFGDVFRKETKLTWDIHMKLKKRILTEMTKEGRMI